MEHNKEEGEDVSDFEKIKGLFLKNESFENIQLTNEILERIEELVVIGIYITDAIKIVLDCLGITDEKFYNLFSSHNCCKRHTQRICYYPGEKDPKHCYKNSCVCSKKCKRCQCPCRNYLRSYVEYIKNDSGVDIANE